MTAPQEGNEVLKDGQRAVIGSGDWLGDFLGERLALAYRFRQQGMTFKEMAREMGISTSLARDRFLSAERRLAWSMVIPDDVQLSIRASNYLRNAGLQTRDQVRDAFLSGRLKPNFGWKVHKEIAKWLDLSEPKKQARRHRKKICPHCGGKLS